LMVTAWTSSVLSLCLWWLLSECYLHNVTRL